MNKICNAQLLNDNLNEIEHNKRSIGHIAHLSNSTA